MILAFAALLFLSYLAICESLERRKLRSEQKSSAVVEQENGVKGLHIVEPIVIDSLEQTAEEATISESDSLDFEGEEGEVSTEVDSLNVELSTIE